MTGGRPLRILIWYPFGLGPDYHGPSIATYRLMKALRRRHATEVTLVHTNPDQKQDRDIADHYVRLAGPTLKHPHLPLRAYARYVRDSWVWLRTHHRDFDVFYSPASNKLTLTPARFARAAGIPTIGRIAAAAAELGDLSTLKKLLGVGRARRASLRKMDRIVALSLRIRDQLIGYGFPADKIKYLPNGVDIERFHPATAEERADARRHYHIPEDVTVACCVGAITDRKGQYFLIEAAARLPSDLHILLAGPSRDPALRARIDALIAQAGLEGRIHQAGHVHDVERVYWASDVFCLVSTDEGMPNALIEAMAAGIPGIGTPISGIEDLLVEGRGRFVSRDAASIAEALEAYRADPALRHREGAKSRSFIVENQSADHVADETAALFRSAVETGKRGRG